MVFGINNPLPSSMRSECKKAARILTSFVDPRQAFSPDKVIPPEILAQAKGLAILTVIKAGFLGSVRGGSGVVVARLSDGSWSAPSAIGTGGAGFGGQIGFELTDFVFILNNQSAVKAFSQQGSITLGTNVSIAAGPVGRNAEAAGAASLKGVAAVFSYSKTKGLFAGVSLEGSVIIERRDANEKLYNSRMTAAQLLEGGVRPPPESEPLMRVLNTRIFSPNGLSAGSNMYNDIPTYDDDDSASDVYHQPPSNRRNYDDDNYGRDTRDTYGREKDNYGRDRADSYGRNDRDTFGGSYGSKPARPAAPKPSFKPKPTAGDLGHDQAIALFTFDAAQPGDLGFKKGEIITIVKRTENATDWWTGRIGSREGIFPSNYVETRS